MKIKTAKQPSFLTNFLLLIGILAVLLISAFFTKKKDAPLFDLKIPPPTATGFLKKKSSILEVLGHYQDHTIFFSVKDEASFKFPQQMREQLAAIGGDTLAQLGNRYSYAGIYKNGKIIKEAMGDSTAVSLSVGNTTVESAGNVAGNFSRLTLNDVLYAAVHRGLNLFVVNPKKQLIGTWSFDFFETETPVSSAMNWMGGTLKHLEIVLAENQYQILKAKRDQAIRSQVLLTSDDDYVPGHLLSGEKAHQVQMRLKGDWVDHLQGDQWSFRIKMNPGETLMGMRKFSLHRPVTRNYAGEWLFHQALADAGVVSLQYHFVQVALKVESTTGSEVKNLGTYALEEGFDKQLIERNQRREGVILKLDESLMWEEYEAYLNNRATVPDITYLDFHKYGEMNIVPFGENRIRADSTLYKQYLTGSSLFRDFVDGKKKLSEVFDMEKVAFYTAISNLLGATHALWGHNYRVYYNPVTSKLEPVAFDGNAGKMVFGFREFYNSRNDLEYQEAYIKAVEEVTSDAYLQKLINWPRLAEKIALMKTVDHKYELTPDLLLHNQRMLQAHIRPKRPLRINFNGMEDRRFHVNVENFSRFPMEVTDISYDGKKVFGKTEERTIVPPFTRIQVTFKLDRDFEKAFTKKGRYKIGFNVRNDIDRIRVAYKTIGSKFTSYERIMLWQNDRGDIAKTDPFQRAPNAHLFDFLVFDENEKTITCKPGDWDVEYHVTIPPGYTFVAGPGCRLNLMSQFTSIYSYSPLRFIGTPSHPVEIYSDTGMGQGILVSTTSDTSLLRYCKFTGLSNPETAGWSVTGAVNFYEADVAIGALLF